MIRWALRAALACAATAWIADRLLARRASGGTPRSIESSVVIDAPIDHVWQVLADVAAQPRWMRDMKAVRIATPGEVGVGTRAEADVRIFGLQTLDPIKITAFEPPLHFAIRHEGRFSGNGDIRLEPGVDGRTTLVSRAETIVPPGLPHLGAWALGPVLRRVFQADLDRFRDLAETAPGGI
jgi:uncharacterized membrane protein